MIEFSINDPILSNPDYVGPDTVYTNQEERDYLWFELYKHYYNISFPTNRETDKKKAEQLIAQFYDKFLGIEIKDPENFFVWAASPYEIQHFAGEEHKSKFDSNYFSHQDASWVINCIFQMKYEPGLPKTRELWTEKVGKNNIPKAEIPILFNEIIKTCSYWWPFENHVFICENPYDVKVNDDNRYHCIDGPAIKYRDGRHQYFVGGVRVDSRIIEHPESITIDEIRKESNMEIKSIMMEKYGFRRYFKDIGAKLIDQDSVPIGGGVDGEIIRNLIHDNENNAYLLTSDGSTDRIFCMNVENTAKTCREAHEGISLISEEFMEGNC